jgi:hypothetical protein
VVKTRKTSLKDRGRGFPLAFVWFAGNRPFWSIFSFAIELISDFPSSLPLEYEEKKEDIKMTSVLKSTERKYSAIVFGATGFTGQYVVKELFDSKSHDFAIAGRYFFVLFFFFFAVVVQLCCSFIIPFSSSTRSETGLKNILNKMAPTLEVAAKIGGKSDILPLFSLLSTPLLTSPFTFFFLSQSL